MRHIKAILAMAAALALAHPAAAAEAVANRLYVEAVRALVGLDDIVDPAERLARVDAAERALSQIVDDHPETAAALRAVELLHPDAAAALADLEGLRAAAEAAGPAVAAADVIAAQANASEAFARLTLCTEAAPPGCLRAAATAKLVELGLLEPTDGGQAAALAGLDVVQQVAAGEPLSVPGGEEADALWARTTAVYAALDLWSQVGGIASMAPWQAVPPEALPEDLEGSLDALLAHLGAREAEADEAVADIVASACAADPVPSAAALAPALCETPPALDAFTAAWQDLPPFQRMGALEAVGQAMRQRGQQALWAALLYGLERPDDLAPEEAAALARMLVGGAVGWRVAPFR